MALGGATLIGGPAFAQTVEAMPALAPALAQVAALMERARVPGAGVTVVHQGRIAATLGLGMASLPFRVAAGEDTLFHLGSVSKQITAALVLELVEAGAIGLDDPVGRHARGLPAAFADIPVRHLLSHTSGAPDYEGLEGFAPDRAIAREVFLSRVAALPAQFAPGAAWAYSNTGYVLLGYLLADVTGRSYRELATERLFGRIGLPSARIDDAGAVVPGRAEPYSLDDGQVRHAVGMDGDYSGWPDGGVLMSARDAARWEQALQTGPAPSAATAAGLISPALMASGRSAAYGAGWFTDQVAGADVQYHSGSVPGFLTYAWRAPATGTAVTVMANLESAAAGGFVREAALNLSEAVAPGSTPLSLDPIRDDAPEITAEALSLFARGDTPLRADRFTSEIAALVGTRAHGALPPNLGADVAGLGWTLTGTHAEPGGQVRRYRMTRGEVRRHIAVAYAPDGRIYRVRVL